MQQDEDDEYSEGEGQQSEEERSEGEPSEEENDGGEDGEDNDELGDSDEVREQPVRAPRAPPRPSSLCPWPAGPVLPSLISYCFSLRR